MLIIDYLGTDLFACIAAAAHSPRVTPLAAVSLMR